VIGPPGGGDGGSDDYRAIIKDAYDQAWIHPTDVTSATASVQVEVVVSRTGKVIDDRITRRSGIGALDHSVQEALDQVRLNGLPPFPPGTVEDKRSFLIDFRLRDRLLFQG
jgi:TonB family protein